MSRDKHIVEIYTDGACEGNPGPGGWGALLRYKDSEKEISGSTSHTTNNQMELLATVKALESVKKAVSIHLYTDSTYVKNGITLWIERWKKNGWKTSNKEPVKNRALWEQLDALASQHSITWHWVRGHAGHLENERADKLARSAIQGLKL